MLLKNYNNNQLIIITIKLYRDQKGFASFIQLLSGEKAGERQKWRTEILNTTPNEFKQFADKLRKLRETGIIIIIIIIIIDFREYYYCYYYYYYYYY